MTAPAEVQPVGHMVELHDRTALPAVQDQATGPAAIVGLLELAIEKGIPVESLEKLQAMYERASDRAAAAEFAQALAAFQQKCPPIAKNKTAKIVPNSGAAYSYTYAELDHIAKTIRPILTELGFSYTWDSQTEGELLTCACTLRHVNGHKVTAKFSAPVQSAAGMSAQQKHASALTYARRQSLIQVLGLTTCEPDLDGANPEKITDEQANDLQALITENGKSVGRFLKWAGVEKLADIRAVDFDSAINAAKAKPAPAKKEAEA